MLSGARSGEENFCQTYSGFARYTYDGNFTADTCGSDFISGSSNLRRNRPYLRHHAFHAVFPVACPHRSDVLFPAVVEDVDV